LKKVLKEINTLRNYMEIIGLKQKVNDNINKLILKFVGLPVHPTANMIKQKIERVFKLAYRVYSLHPNNEYKSILEFYNSSIDEYTFYYKFRYSDPDMKHNGFCRVCKSNGRRLDWDSLHLNPDESIINGICLRCIEPSGCWCAGRFIEGGCTHCTAVENSNNETDTDNDVDSDSD
jgi:hypothetical protein